MFENSKITRDIRKSFAPKLMKCSVSTLAAVFSLTNVASAATLEEVVVTAQKRSESVQDIPFAITALESDSMDKAGISSLEGYANLIPGLAISGQDNGRTQINIRGISAGEVRRGDNTSSETVGMYFDEIPLSLALYNPDLEPFDLARVEVLRGPQGTLYGSGSLAGTIRLISNPPEMNVASGKIDVGISNTEDGDDSNFVKGMINIPIIDDTLAARLVVYRTDNGGWVDNEAPGPYGGSDVNSSEKSGGRLSVLWQPTENLTIRPTVIHQETETDGTAEESYYVGLDPFIAEGFVTEDFVPGDNKQWMYEPQLYTDDIDIFNVLVEYDFGDYTLTSSSSVTDREIQVQADLTADAGLAFGFGPNGPYGQALFGWNFSDNKTSDSFSQELRLSSDSESTLQWIAGVYYTESDSEWGQPLFVTDPAALAPEFDWIYDPDVFGATEHGMTNEGFADLEYEQKAVFGEVTYQLAEKWSAIAGLRWYDAEQGYTTGARGILSGGLTVNDEVKSSEDGVNPKLMLAYTPSEDLLFSFQASEGFRLGGPQTYIPEDSPSGFQCRALIAEQGLDFDPDQFDSETLWNYELAMKSTLADGAIKFNASLFHIVYEDLQVATRILDTTGQDRLCGQTVRTNAGEAQSQGLELELAMQATENLTLSFTGAFVNAELKDDLPNGEASSGDDLLFSPDTTFSANAYYQRPMFESMTGYINLAYQYTGEVEALQPNIVQVTGGLTDSSLDAYDTVNLRVGLQNEDWELALTANNLLDENASTYNQFIGVTVPDGNGGIATTTGIRPRTVGVNFKYNF